MFIMSAETHTYHLRIIIQMRCLYGLRRGRLLPAEQAQDGQGAPHQGQGRAQGAGGQYANTYVGAILRVIKLGEQRHRTTERTSQRGPVSTQTSVVTLLASIFA